MRVVASSLLVALVGAAVPYDSVELNCGSAPVVYVGNPQRLSHAAVMGSTLPGTCTATPNNPNQWPPTGITEFAGLKVAVSGGGKVSNANNPGAEFTNFEFLLEAGAETGPQELTAAKMIEPFDLCVYAPDLARTTVDCGDANREAGDVLECVVKSMDSKGNPMYIKQEMAKPNVDVNGEVVEWNAWEKNFPQLGTEFDFQVTMNVAGTYTISLNGQVIKVNAVAPPDFTTTVKCKKRFIDVGLVDEVFCEIEPRSGNEIILAEPYTVYPVAPGLKIRTEGSWTTAQNSFRFFVSSGGKAGLFTVMIGDHLNTFTVTVLAEPNNSTSTCVCDSAEIYVGSSVVCTSTARDEKGNPVDINIDRYVPVSTSDRDGVARGFSAGYIYPVTPRTSGEVTVGKEFQFRFMAEDRGFEEREVEPAFTSQLAAKSECTRNDAAHLCSEKELQYILDHNYISMSTRWGFASDDDTMIYHINTSSKIVEVKALSTTKSASAFCCSAAGSLNGKTITLQDGVIKRHFPLLTVAVAGDVNATVTTASTLLCTSPIKQGEHSTCVFTARTSAASAVAILADRVKVMNKPIPGEAGNVRKIFTFVETPGLVGEASVEVEVANPQTGKVLTLTTKIEVAESDSPTAFPTASPTLNPTALPTKSPSPHPTNVPTEKPTAPTTQYPTKPGQTFAPTPSLKPPSMQPTVQPTVATTTDSAAAGGGGDGGSDGMSTTAIVLIILAVLIAGGLVAFWLYRRQKNTGLELQPYEEQASDYHPPI